MAPGSRTWKSRRVLTLAEVWLDLVPSPFVKAIFLSPALIAPRSSSCHQHGVDPRCAAEALGGPDTILPSMNTGHRFAVPSTLDLQRVSHPVILADKRHPRHKIVLDVALLDKEHRDRWVFGQSRCYDATRCSTYTMVKSAQPTYVPKYPMVFNNAATRSHGQRRVLASDNNIVVCLAIHVCCRYFRVWVERPHCVCDTDQMLAAIWASWDGKTK